jgi:hypothetical protein
MPQHEAAEAEKKMKEAADKIEKHAKRHLKELEAGVMKLRKTRGARQELIDRDQAAFDNLTAELAIIQFKKSRVQARYDRQIEQRIALCKTVRKLERGFGQSVGNFFSLTEDYSKQETKVMRHISEAANTEAHGFSKISTSMLPKDLLPLSFRKHNGNANSPGSFSMSQSSHTLLSIPRSPVMGRSNPSSLIGGSPVMRPR